MVRATGQAVVPCLLVCLRQLFPATKICEQLSARQSKAIRNVDVHNPLAKDTPNGKTSPDDDVQGQRTNASQLEIQSSLRKIVSPSSLTSTLSK
ncbi:hypothetical protein L210DRAFT_3546469 [Boletus edulis BED1]|uniref:Uncharacterized protein n=1 Tax=Boletus edulis BED1 TaxID=1328754 RepID=A0AAD4GDA0_BOLED|nr:hypothetical protein L210DRAFT_3546469 [Boletus edulis BED1]